MERVTRNRVVPAGRPAPAGAARRLAILLLLAAIALFTASAFPAAPAAARGAPAPAIDRLALQDPETPDDGDDGDYGEGEEEPEDDGDPGAEPPTMKPPPIVPDSLRKTPAATIPVGGAPVETLVVRPSNVLGRPGATAPKAPEPKARRTPFGLHPAALFAVLVVGHVFLVRAVTD